MSADTTTAMATLARAYLRTDPEEASRVLDDAPVAEVLRVLRGEPVRYAVPVLEYLPASIAAEVIGELPSATATTIATAMEPASLVGILAWMDDGAAESLLKTLDAGLARDLREMRVYPPDTAGRLMDPRAVGFRPGATVKEALARVRAARSRRVSDVFLTDADRVLTGRVPLQVLAVSPPNALLETLAEPAAPVEAIAPQEEVVERFTKGAQASVPVVDFEGRFLGVIRYDTLAGLAQENAAGDIQAMVGVGRDERVLSPVTFAVRKRLPWLQINLATAFLAASVVGLFEETIARFTALAVLLPVVAGQSGNTGAQALAVTMRGLAMREIRVGQWPRVVRKEAGVAFLNGVAVSLTTSAGVFLWSRSIGLALVIGISMVLSMIAAGVSGVLVPTALTMVGQDPAQSSSIILTTVTDIVGFASFLGIATLLSGML